MESNGALNHATNATNSTHATNSTRATNSNNNNSNNNNNATTNGAVPPPLQRAHTELRLTRGVTRLLATACDRPVWCSHFCCFSLSLNYFFKNRINYRHYWILLWVSINTLVLVFCFVFCLISFFPPKLLFHLGNLHAPSARSTASELFFFLCWYLWFFCSNTNTTNTACWWRHWQWRWRLSFHNENCAFIVVFQRFFLQLIRRRRWWWRWWFSARIVDRCCSVWRHRSNTSLRRFRTFFEKKHSVLLVFNWHDYLEQHETSEDSPAIARAQLSNQSTVSSSLDTR